MRKTILHLVVALMTFTVGVAAVWLCSFAPSKETATSELNENVVLLAAPPVKQRFTSTFRACKPGWVQGYITSDGERLSESGNRFSSPALASGKLQKWMKGAEKIIERAPRFDSKGKKVGERVIAAYPPNDHGVKWVSIMWTDKNGLGSINAPSLQLALEFEKHRLIK
jgi:hypothetical protein